MVFRRFFLVPWFFGSTVLKSYILPWSEAYHSKHWPFEDVPRVRQAAHEDCHIIIARSVFSFGHPT